jgi:hypothetical protein
LLSRHGRRLGARGFLQPVPSQASGWLPSPALAPGRTQCPCPRQGSSSRRELAQRTHAPCRAVPCCHVQTSKSAAALIGKTVAAGARPIPVHANPIPPRHNPARPATPLPRGEASRTPALRHGLAGDATVVACPHAASSARHPLSRVLVLLPLPWL